jgi:aminoglycoside N3'-acetyltransferase
MMSEARSTSDMQVEINALSRKFDELQTIMLAFVSASTAQQAISQAIFARLFEGEVLSRDTVCHDIESMIEIFKGANDSDEVISALEDQLHSYRDPEHSLRQSMGEMFKGGEQ